MSNNNGDYSKKLSVNLKCQRCKHVWTYKGIKAFEKGFTSCASCKTNVSIKTNKVLLVDSITKKEIYLPDQRTWGKWNKRSIEQLRNDNNQV